MRPASAAIVAPAASRRGPAIGPAPASRSDLRSAIGSRRWGEDKTPRADCAAINLVWVSLVAGLLAATRGRASRDPITNKELIPISAATFAVSKAVARERIGAWMREPFVEESESQKPKG